MNEGFFSQSELTSSTPRIPHSSRCGLCGLYRTCITPKMKAYGKGRRKILIIAEAPGKHEDKIGRPLVGKTGMRLDSGFDSIGINMTRDCWRTNAVICRPPENKTPDSKKIQACLPNLKRTVSKLKPNVILLIGAVAVESFMNMIGMTESGYSIGQWINWSIPLQKLNCWTCIAYHPSYLMRLQSPVADNEFQKTLKQVKKLSKSRPWKDIPNYRDKIELIYKPRNVKQIIKEIIKKKKPASFDYEANCLKPEYEGAELVSCSISNGNRTIAYPWNDENCFSTSKLLTSPLKKVAANMKFEERWTKYFLHISVENWWWDTMLAAHVLDHRSGITSLTFQSFVKLGLLPYDRHIKPFLKQTSKDNPINQIREIPLKDLLLYNGMDSLTCHDIMKIQRKEMKNV